MEGKRELRARREIGGLCRQGLDWTALVEQASRVVGRVVPHERFCMHSVDPATMLITGGLARNLDRVDGYPRMVQNEYVEVDVNKWASLARLERPAASLTEATRGRPERSVRYRELLRPQQCAWELRAALVSRERCWGALAFYRSEGERDFSEAEIAFMAGISAMLADGFRRSLVVGALPQQAAGPDGPGLIVFDEKTVPVEIAPAAERWLAELRGRDGVEEGWLPVEVYAVATRARSDAAGDARVRVRAPSGRWLSLYGTPLGAARTAVIIQPAAPHEITELIVDSYELTARERTITTLTLQGLSTGEIARAVHVTTYTVQDHLKAIFRKTGVSSRRELVARIFYDQHFPRIMAGVRPGADGGFAGPVRPSEQLTRL
jgi:DNA-binding CsgD family transcriptional regulator